MNHREVQGRMSAGEGEAVKAKLSIKRGGATLYHWSLIGDNDPTVKYSKEPDRQNDAECLQQRKQDRFHNIPPKIDLANVLWGAKSIQQVFRASRIHMMNFGEWTRISG